MHLLMIGLLLIAAGSEASPAERARGQARSMASLTLERTRPVIRPLVHSVRGRVKPPRTPKGLPRCTQSIKPVADIPRLTGETIRYLVDVDGLSIGTVDFKIERQGHYAGTMVTEYRSLFELDALAATLVPVKGRAASLVPQGGFWPLKAMNRYDLRDNVYEEDVDYDVAGRAVVSRRSKNGTAKDARRSFNDPVPDFVSAFYMLRRFPRDMNGCTILYGNQRAYTIWMEPDGTERVKTPVGRKIADRYKIRYASERSRRTYEGKVWIGTGPERLPYRAEINGKYKLEARIHLYEIGQ